MKTISKIILKEIENNPSEISVNAKAAPESGSGSGNTGSNVCNGFGHFYNDGNISLGDFSWSAQGEFSWNATVGYELDENQMAIFKSATIVVTNLRLDFSGIIKDDLNGMRYCPDSLQFLKSSFSGSSGMASVIVISTTINNCKFSGIEGKYEDGNLNDQNLVEFGNKTVYVSLSFTFNSASRQLEFDQYGCGVSVS